MRYEEMRRNWELILFILAIFFAVVMSCVVLTKPEREAEPMGNILATYAGIGIEAGSGVNFTLQRGISPSITTVTLKAGTVIGDVPRNGDLVLTDGAATITIPVWVDGDIVQKRNRGGTLISVTLKDRRWKWKYGYYSRRYNEPDGEGKPVQTTHAQDIFDSLRGYINIGGAPAGQETAATFVITAVPIDKYPALDVEVELPIQIMQQLCEDLGLIVCLGTDSVARVRELGVGVALPAGSINDEVTTAQARELPNGIIIRGSRTVQDFAFDVWEAVGEETEANDSEIKPLTELSYKPGGGTIAEWGEALKSDFVEFVDEEENKLAKKCALKWYRWRQDDVEERNFFLPWMPTRSAPVTIGGVVQEANERADPLMKVSYVEQDELMWRYVDHTLKQVTDGWSLEHDKGIIQFNEAKYKRDNTGDPFLDVIELPDIELTVAYENNSGLGIADFYNKVYTVVWSGGATYSCGVHVEDMTELVEYLDDGGISYNKTELDAYCDDILPLIQKNFWDGVTGSAKTYLGIKDVSPDGAITSVTWHVSKTAATTEVVRGIDMPPVNLPTYADFRAKQKNKRDTRKAAATDKDIDRKTREGRGGRVMRKPEGRPTTFKGRRLGELAVKNVDATNAPAGGLAEIVDVEDATGAVEVKRPTDNDLTNVVVLKHDVAAGKYSSAREGKATGFVKHTGAVPAVGELLGTVKDQWEGEVSNGGTHEVTGVDASSNAYAKPAGGGGGGLAPIKITAKVNDTTYTGDVYRNGTDAAATEAGATIRILQIAAGETIPNNTILPAWKQKWAGVSAWTVDLARDY